MSLDPKRREQLLAQVSERVVRLGIASPAILLLEMHKPLAFLGAQMLWAIQPLLGLWWGDADVHDMALLLEEQAGVDALIARLEAASAS